MEEEKKVVIVGSRGVHRVLPYLVAAQVAALSQPTINLDRKSAQITPSRHAKNPIRVQQDKAAIKHKKLEKRKKMRRINPKSFIPKSTGKPSPRPNRHNHKLKAS